MRHHLAIVRLPFLEHRALRYLGLVWLVGGTTLGVGLARSSEDFSSWRNIAMRTLATPIVSMGLVLWLVFAHGVDAQLSPAAVQLVPRLRRRATITTMVLWGMMSAAMGLEIAAFGMPATSTIAIVATGLALCISRTKYARAVALLILLSLFCICGFPIRFPLSPWLGLVALAAAIAFGPFWIASQLGGTAEARAVPHERIKQARRLRRGSNNDAAWTAFLRRMRAEKWAFDRMIHTPDPAARALLGLGPTFHWGRAILASIVPTAWMFSVWHVLFNVVLSAFGGDEKGAETIANMGTWMAFIQTTYLAESYLRTISLRRKEESLLVLLPGLPRGREVNAWLMRALLLRHAVAITGASVALSSTSILLGYPATALIKAGAAPLTASLLVAPALLRNYAGMRSVAPFHLMLPAGLGVVAVQMAIGVQRIGLDAKLVLAVGVPVSAVLVAIRYARLLDAPPALPAGRLAS